jgi:hypothetical protein
MITLEGTVSLRTRVEPIYAPPEHEEIAFAFGLT